MELGYEPRQLDPSTSLSMVVCMLLVSYHVTIMESESQNRIRNWKGTWFSQGWAELKMPTGKTSIKVQEVARNRGLEFKQSLHKITQTKETRE